MERSEKPSPAARMIRKRRDRAEIRSGYINLLMRMAVIALLCVLVSTQLFLITQASGNDMFPSIKDGDLIIAYRIQHRYVKNDIVVYDADGRRRIGRVAATENDVVMLDDSGALIVNGTTQGGEIIYPTYAEGDLTYPYRVPEGSVFVLGDHRTAAQDSRHLGAVPKDSVEGKIITILRRRGL